MFYVKLSSKLVICRREKKRFTVKKFAITHVLKRRLGVTQKLLIDRTLKIYSAVVTWKEFHRTYLVSTTQITCVTNVKMKMSVI